MIEKNPDPTEEWHAQAHTFLATLEVVKDLLWKAARRLEEVTNDPDIWKDMAKVEETLAEGFAHYVIGKRALNELHDDADYMYGFRAYMAACDRKARGHVEDVIRILAAKGQHTAAAAVRDALAEGIPAAERQIEKLKEEGVV